MSHWNYRVMQFPEPDAHFAIHEVYYGDNGEPSLYSCGAVPIWEDDVNAGLAVLFMMQKAFALPVLTPDDFKAKP